MYCYSSKFSVSWFRSFPLSLFLHSFSEWILSIFSVLELKKKFISKADFPVYLSFFNGKRNPTYLTFWTDALILFSRVFHLSVLLFGEFSQFSFCWTFNLGKYLNFKESCLFYIILILLFWKIGLIFCQFFLIPLTRKCWSSLLFLAPFFLFLIWNSLCTYWSFSFTWKTFYKYLVIPDCLFIF